MPDRRKILRELIERQTLPQIQHAMWRFELTDTLAIDLMTAGAWYAPSINRRQWISKVMLLLFADTDEDISFLEDRAGLTQDLAIFVVAYFGSFVQQFRPWSEQGPLAVPVYRDILLDIIRTPDGRMRAQEALENYCERCEETTLDFMAGYAQATTGSEEED